MNTMLFSTIVWCSCSSSAAVITVRETMYYIIKIHVDFFIYFFIQPFQIVVMVIKYAMKNCIWGSQTFRSQCTYKHLTLL